MVKVAGSFAALLVVSGLALAQTDAQQPAAKTSKHSGSTAVAIQHWHGTLVDAACAGGGTSTAATGQTGTNDSANTKSGETKKQGKKEKTQQAQSCPVSASTSMFALKTPDGQVMKFDSVGSARTAEELKNKGSWSKDLTAGKPIRAKVSGTLNGDTITVTSIG